MFLFFARWKGGEDFITEWMLIIEANLDVGVEAENENDAMEKAERLLEKIMIPDTIIDNTQISVNLELKGVFKI